MPSDPDPPFGWLGERDYRVAVVTMYVAGGRSKNLLVKGDLPDFSIRCRYVPRTRPSYGAKVSWMKIRGAAPADSSEIARINVLGWKAAAKGHIPAERMVWLDATIGERSLYWAAIASGEDNDHVLVVAEKAGEVIGFVHAVPSRDPGASSDAAEISTLFVCPEHWGKGVGRALLGAALEELRRREYSSVTLWVLDFNEWARRFYERAAFAPDGSSKVSEFNGIPLGEVRYERSL